MRFYSAKDGSISLTVRTLISGRYSPDRAPQRDVPGSAVVRSVTAATRGEVRNVKY